MRIIVLCLLIISLNKINAQCCHQVWSHKIYDYVITFNFERESFKVDTIDFYEGLVFYFKSPNDSSYLRLNYISPNAKFECCAGDSVYNETNIIFENGVFDRKGRIKGTNLYWREIKNKDVEIVYNNCSKNKIKFYNKILDSIYKELKWQPPTTH